MTEKPNLKPSSKVIENYQKLIGLYLGKHGYKESYKPVVFQPILGWIREYYKCDMCLGQSNSRLDEIEKQELLCLQNQVEKTNVVVAS